MIPHDEAPAAGGDGGEDEDRDVGVRRVQDVTPCAACGGTPGPLNRSERRAMARQGRPATVAMRHRPGCPRDAYSVTERTHIGIDIMRRGGGQ